VLSLQSTDARWPCQHVRSRPALRREHRPVRSGSHSLVGGGHPRQRTALKGLPVVDLGPARAARFDRRTPAAPRGIHPPAPRSRVGGGHPPHATARKGPPVVDLGPARAARFDRRTPAAPRGIHPQAPKIRKGGQAPCRRVARLWFVKTETRSYYEAAVERAV